MIVCHLLTHNNDKDNNNNDKDKDDGNDDWCFVCEDNCQENNLSSTKLHFINYLLRLTKPLMSLSETIVRRFIVKEFSLSQCPVTFLVCYK